MSSVNRSEEEEEEEEEEDEVEMKTHHLTFFLVMYKFDLTY
jgi:hypothetical protein